MEDHEAANLDWEHLLSQILLLLEKIAELFQKHLQLAQVELKQDILRPIRYLIFIFIALILLLPASMLLLAAFCFYLSRFWPDLAGVCAVVGLVMLLTGAGLAYVFYRRLSRGLTFLKLTRANIQHLLGSKVIP